jgi:hypothetical protein
VFYRRWFSITEGIDEQKTKEETKEVSVKQPSASVTQTSESNGNLQKASWLQIIKSVWTHEPWKYFNVIRKGVDVMGDYIALHGFVPQNELPAHLRNKIPENEIWMREDIYDNLERRKRILTHEYVELDLMITYSMSYKEAHSRAEFYEGMWYQQ